MKKFPEVSQSCEDLFKMLLAPIRSKLLFTGIELKVFNQLSEPITEDKTPTGLPSDQTENQVRLVPEEAPDTDWEISYRPLKHHADPPEVDAGQVQDG